MLIKKVMTAIGLHRNRDLAFYPNYEKISWEDFEQEYLSREDEWKYEWVNGYVEKTERTMNQYQFFILANLRECFENLKREGKITGYLEAEVDAYFLENVHRIPDIAYYTNEQVAKMGNGENQVPEFVIEIISKTDNINRVTKKMKNYREARVAVVWHVFPDLKEIHIYHGTEMTTVTGDEICSAVPVLPDFNISVNDIFKKVTP